MSTLYAVLDHPAVKWLILVFALVMPLASLLTWAERRQSAMMRTVSVPIAPRCPSSPGSS
jgi:predicted membrane protein